MWRIFVVTGKVVFTPKAYSGFSNERTAMPQLAEKDDLISRVVYPDARSYIEEAIKCFEVDAYRASVVMMCCAVFQDIRLKAYGLSSYDPWFEKFSKHVEHMRERQDSFESNVMEKVRSAKLFNDEQKSYLERIWRSRNEAAHPTSVTISRQLAEDFIVTGANLFLCDKALLGDPGVDIIIEQLENLEIFAEGVPVRDGSIAKSMLQDVLLGAAYYKLADKIVKKLGIETTPRFRRNSVAFLKSMAFMRTADSMAALNTALVHRRTPEPSDTWMLEVIGVSPDMLNSVSVAGRKGLDASLANMCRSFDRADIADDVTRFEELLEAVKGELGPMGLNESYPKFRDALVSLVWSQPALVACLATEGALRTSAIYELHQRLEEPVQAGHFVRMLVYRRFEKQLAEVLSDEEAFTILSQIACAAVNRDRECNRLLDGGFANVPSLLVKAVNLARENADEANAILSSYNGHWDLATMRDALGIDEVMDAETAGVQ